MSISVNELLKTVPDSPLLQCGSPEPRPHTAIIEVHSSVSTQVPDARSLLALRTKGPSILYTNAFTHPTAPPDRHTDQRRGSIRQPKIEEAPNGGPDRLHRMIVQMHLAISGWQPRRHIALATATYICGSEEGRREGEHRSRPSSSPSESGHDSHSTRCPLSTVHRTRGRPHPRLPRPRHSALRS